MKEYIYLKKFIDTPSCTKNKLARIVQKVDFEVFNQGKFLRLKVWSVLLPEINPFFSYPVDICHLYQELNGGLIEAEEIRQIQSDIKRCVNFHPLLRLELIQKQLVALIVTFLSLNKDFAYIQGLDSIAVVLFT